MALSASVIRYRSSPKGLATYARIRADYNARRRIRRATDSEYKAVSILKSKLHYKNNREQALQYVYEKKYGITLQRRDEILVEQGNVCALCGVGNKKKNKRWWHTDHDPKKRKGEPGFIRGILCANCNTGLGKFKDNPELLAKAKQYLEYSRGGN